MAANTHMIYFGDKLAAAVSMTPEELDLAYALMGARTGVLMVRSAAGTGYAIWAGGLVSIVEIAPEEETSDRPELRVRIDRSVTPELLVSVNPEADALELSRVTAVSKAWGEYRARGLTIDETVERINKFLPVKLEIVDA